MTVWRQKQKLSASQLVTWCCAAVCSGSSCLESPIPTESQLKSDPAACCLPHAPLSWENIRSCSSLALSQRAPTSREGKALLQPHAVSNNILPTAVCHPVLKLILDEHICPSHYVSFWECPLQGPYPMYNLHKAFLTPGLPQAAALSTFHPSPLEKGGKESEPERSCRHVTGDGCWGTSQHCTGNGWSVLTPHQAPKEPCALRWWGCLQPCLQTPLRLRAERRQPGENLPALCLTLSLQHGCMCGS